MSLSWTASHTYAKLVYGKCPDIIWHHVRAYQWFKDILLFQGSKLSGSYSRHVSILFMSGRCHKVRVATGFCMATYWSCIPRYPNLNEIALYSMGQITPEHISYTSVFLTSNWKSLCRVKAEENLAFWNVLFLPYIIFVCYHLFKCEQLKRAMALVCLLKHC